MIEYDIKEYRSTAPFKGWELAEIVSQLSDYELFEYVKELAVPHHQMTTGLYNYTYALRFRRQST